MPQKKYLHPDNLAFCNKCKCVIIRESDDSLSSANSESVYECICELSDFESSNRSKSNTTQGIESEIRSIVDNDPAHPPQNVAEKPQPPIPEKKSSKMKSLCMRLCQKKSPKIQFNDLCVQTDGLVDAQKSDNHSKGKTAKNKKSDSDVNKLLNKYAPGGANKCAGGNTNTIIFPHHHQQNCCAGDCFSIQDCLRNEARNTHRLVEDIMCEICKQKREIREVKDTLDTFVKLVKDQTFTMASMGQIDPKNRKKIDDMLESPRNYLERKSNTTSIIDSIHEEMAKTEFADVAAAPEQVHDDDKKKKSCWGWCK